MEKREQKWVLICSNTLLFCKLLTLVISWSLYFEFGLGLTLELGYSLGLVKGWG